MASPQKENGYTPIANEIMEHIYMNKFTAIQLRMLLIVLRFTYGYQKKAAELSLNFIANTLGIQPSNASRELKKLRDLNVIFIDKATGKQPQRITFNKDYQKWCERVITSDNSTVITHDNSGVITSDNSDLSPMITEGLSPVISKKENNKEKYINNIVSNIEGVNNYIYNARTREEKTVGGDKQSVDRDKRGVGERNDTLVVPYDMREATERRYGEFKNVSLSDSELQKLRGEFADTEDYIEKLSRHMKSTGRKYQSHYATLKQWLCEDRDKKGRSGKGKKSRFNNFSDDMNDFERKMIDKRMKGGG